MKSVSVAESMVASRGTAEKSKAMSVRRASPPLVRPTNVLCPTPLLSSPSA
jgi:hypothetical protein